MNTEKKRQQAFERRTKRVRAKVIGTEARPRLAVFRSLKNISAQLIDDTAGRTLLAVSDRELKKAEVETVKSGRGLAGKTARAGALGGKLAHAAIEKGIKKVVFDRRGYRYHGRLKAFADGARAGGLEF